MRVLLALIASACFSADAWADAKAETATALQYTYQAAQAVTLAEVQGNLHRAVNCLVGPKDTLFDAGQPNPCAKMGKGALIDSTDDAGKPHLKNAVDLAEMGIAVGDLEKATMLATAAAGALRESQRATSHGAHNR